MAQEKVVRREVHEETVEETGAPAARGRAGWSKRRWWRRRPSARPGVTNVNVNKDPVSGNVNINTPDGTQVNINT